MPARKKNAKSLKTKSDGPLMFREEDALYSASSKLRPIGNSKGVILPNRIIEEAGISADADLTIRAFDGMILLIETKESNVNTDLSSWDQQFKSAKRQGKEAEKNLWGDLRNHFDEEGWT